MSRNAYLVSDIDFEEVPEVHWICFQILLDSFCYHLQPSGEYVVQKIMTRFDVPDDIFLMYHRLWRNLLHGTTSPFRPPLTAELVRMIVRHAGLIVLDRTLTTVSATSLDVRCRVYAPTVVSRVWFWAGPIDARAPANIAQLQLVTESCDQGWTTDPDHIPRTWFDVGVFPLPLLALPADDPETSGGVWSADNALDARWNVAGPATGAEDWSWLVASRGFQRYFTEQDSRCWRRSHANPCANGRVENRQGSILTLDHSSWAGIAAGHVIAVRVCAQHFNWENKARKGELKVWRYFEPVISV